MIYSLQPLTEKAQHFANQFGTQFSLMAMPNQGELCLRLHSLSTGRLVIVEKKDDGIWINDKWFAEQW